MSKKKLLNERTIRRFGGLAGIKPISTSNFLSEMGGEIPYERDDEEGEGFEVEDELDVEEPDGEELEIEDEEELEVEEPVAGEGDAEGLVLSLLDKVKEWASEQGVEMDVDDEGEIDHEEPVDDDLGDDLGDEMDFEEDEEEVDLEGGDEMDFEEDEEEETLEEMINSILSPKTSVRESRQRTRRAKKRGVKVEVLSDEKVIQEVTKRVKNRLRRIAKVQSRKR